MATFANKERKLELHYRHSLGMVTYHIGVHALEHEQYMKLQKAWPKNHFPCFEPTGLVPFQALAHDLSSYCFDFLAGDGNEFIQLAIELQSNPSVLSGIGATE